MKTIRLITILILFLLLGGVLRAQDALQVVTKRIEKSFAYQDGMEVNIEGERAEVFIEASAAPQISIQLDLIARHPRYQEAKVQVERMQYQAERVKNKIYVRNYLVDNGVQLDEPAQMKAVYRIKVPAECPVYLKNNYGKAEIRDLSNSLKVNSRFSELGLAGLSGFVSVRTRFGDLSGQQLDGNVSVAAHRSDIILRDIKGSYDIEAEYGLVEIYASEGLLNFSLDADKSDVYLYNVDLPRFSYALTANNGEINYPDALNFELQELSDQITKVTFKPNEEYYPAISVRVSFGDIYLRQQPRR